MVYDARLAQQDFESAQEARASYDRLSSALDTYSRDYESSDDDENDQQCRKQREQRWNLRWQVCEYSLHLPIPTPTPTHPFSYLHTNNNHIYVTIHTSNMPPFPSHFLR